MWPEHSILGKDKDTDKDKDKDKDKEKDKLYTIGRYENINADRCLSLFLHNHTKT